MTEPTRHTDTCPRHVAIIMDGNGRWAKAHGKPRHAGHRAGVRATRAIVEAASDRGIAALTLFAFSSENWSRPEAEVSSLMSLFLEVLQREVDVLHEKDTRIRFVGARDQLSARLQRKLADAESQTAHNTGMELALAVAFGGRWDIVEAARRVCRKVERGELSAAAITEEEFAQGLSLRGMPPLDLLIRTGGERRISNFLLWDMAYAELYFTDTLWPEFDPAQLDEALRFYAGRQRRFGRTGEQVSESV